MSEYTEEIAQHVVEAVDFAIKRRDRKIHSDIGYALDKFWGDLAFTAPELYGMRFDDLRMRIADILEG